MSEQRVYEIFTDGVLIKLINPPRTENESYRFMKERAEIWKRYAVNRHGRDIDRFECEWDVGGNLIRQEAFKGGVKK